MTESKRTAGWKIGLMIVAVIGLFRLGMNLDSGTRPECVGRKSEGQFMSFYNRCEKPITATVCTQVLWSPWRCETRNYGPGNFMTVTGSDKAGTLVSVLSPNTQIMACKQGRSPVRVSESPKTYNCSR